MGCGNAEGPGESRELVARAGGCAVFSGVSNDLASPALALFESTVHPDRTTHPLDRRGPFDVWNDPGGVALPVAPRWNERVAAPLVLCLGFDIVVVSAVLLFLRRRDMLPTRACIAGLSTAYLANAALCLVVYSGAAGTFQTKSGWLITMVIVWPMALELVWIFIQAFNTQPPSVATSI
jgi:hypothetical protein